MSKQQYLACRIAVVVLLGLMVSISIQAGNYVLPLVGLAASVAFLYWCRKLVKDVLYDERDLKIAGQSARYAIIAFAFPAAVLVLVFTTLGLHDKSSVYYIAGQTLAYSVCFLTLANAAIYHFLNRRKM